MLERVLSMQEYLNKTMEKWEKRDKKRDSKKRFKDYKNNIKSITTLWDITTKPKRKRDYENDSEE